MGPVNALRNIFYVGFGCFILLVPFLTDSSMVNGLISGKVNWFHSLMLYFSIAFLIVELFIYRSDYRLKIPDIFIFLLLVTVLATYNWKLNPDPEQLLFICQAGMLWIMMRMVFSKDEVVKDNYMGFLLYPGLAQAIWGLLQIYDLTPSNHALFKLTGFFPNPGPYSGYLAMLLPYSLGLILMNAKKEVNGKRKNVATYYVAWATFLAIIMVLPSGMSRSAWIAATISCIWVWWQCGNGWGLIKNYYSRRKYFFIGLSAILLLCVAVSIGGIYHMKKDSADGRLLMWKVTALAIKEKPFTGKGLAGFPAAYASAQADYFKTNQATEQEKMVAGCPEYAFNEYLHILLELGIFGFLFFIFWITSVIYIGIKNRSYAIVGGIISLLIFAFSSYPLHDPSFWPVFIIFSVLALEGPWKPAVNRIWPTGKNIPVLGLIAASVSIFLSVKQSTYSNAYKEWYSVQILYNNKAYEVVLPKYNELSDILSHNTSFLFEHAQCLHHCEAYEEATAKLERASLLSSDPMIHYVLAKNKQEMGEYDHAEELLIHSISILPERIYPYFLLTKLYCSPSYYQPEKFRMAADSVLYKVPKVETTATHEMRREVKKMISRMEENVEEEVY